MLMIDSRKKSRLTSPSIAAREKRSHDPARSEPSCLRQGVGLPFLENARANGGIDKLSEKLCKRKKKGGEERM